MANSLPDLVGHQPSSYDFDSTNTGIVIESYRNDATFQYNDCVIAARAHQTIRFDFVTGVPPLAISSDDVASEYFQENGGGTTAGVDLDISLQLWRDRGWIAAHTKGRTIERFYGPLAIRDSPLFVGDLTMQIDSPVLMNYIYGYTGVQVSLILPDSIDVRSPGSYGSGTLWKDTSQLAVEPHVMLLTGYSDQGPIGITWGKKQAMTWDFLRSYCCGAYVICKGANT